MMTILLDPSASKSAVCARKLYNTVVHGWRERGTNNDLIFGTGFHHWRAALSRGESAKEAQLKALAVFDSPGLVWKEKKEWLNKEYLRATIAHDFASLQERPLEPAIKFADGSLAIEHAWSIPFYRTASVEVILCGTIDRLIELPSGIICIADYKTTASWGSHSYYLNGYRNSSQLMFYAWALKRLVKDIPEATKYKNLNVERIAARIDAVFVGKDKTPSFESSDVMVLDEGRFMDFELSLRKQVKELAEYVEAGYAPRTGFYNGACDHGFPDKCPFYYACGASDPSIERQVLERTFVQREHNPLAYQK